MSRNDPLTNEFFYSYVMYHQMNPPTPPTPPTPSTPSTPPTISMFATHDSVDKNALITGYSFIHFLTGVYMAILMKYFKYSNLQIFLVISTVHLLYEFKDYHTAYNTDMRKSDGTYDNSLLNSIADQVCATLGMILILCVNNTTLNAITKHIVGCTVAYISVGTLFAYMYIVHKSVG